MRLVALIHSVMSALGTLLRIATAVPERLFRGTLQVLDQTSQHLAKRIDRAAAGLVRGLQVAIRQAASWTIFRPVKAGGSVVTGAVRFAGRLGKPILEFLRRLNLERFVRPLWTPLRPLWRVLQGLNIDRYVAPVVRPFWTAATAVGEFGHAWLVTRDYRKLLWGLPAILMLLPFLFIGLRVALLGNGSIVARYRAAVQDALEQKDFDAVQLYNRKLAQLGVATELTHYQTALKLAEEGELPQALERMSQLAPTDSPGFPPAHEWIVRQLLADRIEMPRPEQLEQADRHLQQLERLHPNPQLKYLRAFWLIENGQLEDAATLLGEVAESIPEVRFERMRIQLRLNRPDAARDDARRVASHFEVLRRSGQPLSPEQMEQWALAVSLLDNPRELRAVLETWLAVQPDNPPVRAQLALLLASELQQALGLSGSDSQQLNELFDRIAALSNEQQLWEPLILQIYRHADHPACRHLVERVETTAAITSELLTLAGTRAATEGQHATARRLLQLAVAKDSQNPVAWNNLAWTLSQAEPKDLSAALEAVERSLQLQPDAMRFLETRGQILVQLQQWQPAIDDLELALNVMPESADIHRALAVSYDALGNDEKAAAHYSQAER